MHNLITFECMNVVARCRWKAYSIRNSNFRISIKYGRQLKSRFVECATHDLYYGQKLNFTEFQLRASAYREIARIN